MNPLSQGGRRCMCRNKYHAEDHGALGKLNQSIPRSICLSDRLPLARSALLLSPSLSLYFLYCFFQCTEPIPATMAREELVSSAVSSNLYIYSAHVANSVWRILGFMYALSALLLTSNLIMCSPSGSLSGFLPG